MGRIAKKYGRFYDLNIVHDLTLKYGAVKVLEIPFTAQTTGIDLPAKAAILEALVDVTTADSGITIDVGLKSTESGGDADGFLDGVSVASTGLKKGENTITAGSNNTYVSGTTIGVFLRDLIVGEDVANGGDGMVCRTPFLSDSVTAKSVTYTCSAGADTATGNIYIIYIEFE
ncbi:MAG: hypothetical protein QXI36_02135 [Candidatus Bathyarchaeia archaeon]